jgi:hypothetical protein
MYCDDQIEQERIEANDAARSETLETGIQAVRSLGATDAAFGRLPQFANEPYLEGYIKKIRELPTDANGAIIHHNPSPTRQFAWGYVDNPEPSRASNEF